MSFIKTMARPVTAVITSLALALSMVAGVGAGAGATQETQAQAAASSPEYIAVLGIDTWKNADGSRHMEGSDLTALVRVDAAKGDISIMSIPRDMYFDNTKIDKSATTMKANYAFHYGFYGKIKPDWSNYDAAIKAGGKAACKMLKSVTGIKVTKFAAVDLYTYQKIIDGLGGLSVNIPVGIKNYRLYSNGKFYSVNKGKTGTTKLDGKNAMIASRARIPYGTRDAKTQEATHYYSKKSLYTGDYPELLLKMVNSKGGTYYAFDQDGVRQYLNRRTLTNLIAKGLGKGSKTASYVWKTLVGGGLMWTNYTQDEVNALAKALVKSKDKLTVNAASMITPKGSTYTIKGVTQFLIKAKKSQIKAVVKQFKSGKAMTKGWGVERTYGVDKGTKAKKSGTTYKVTGAATVKVWKAANKKSVVIPATVKINNKTYRVTATAGKSFTASKIRTVTLGSNVKKMAKNSFASSRVTKIKLKTTKLTKAKVKGSLAGSSVKSVVVKVSSKKKAATIKAYKKCFTKKNAGKKVSVS